MSTARYLFCHCVTLYFCFPSHFSFSFLYSYIYSFALLFLFSFYTLSSLSFLLVLFSGCKIEDLLYHSHSHSSATQPNNQLSSAVIYHALSELLAFPLLRKKKEHSPFYCHSVKADFDKFPRPLAFCYIQTLRRFVYSLPYL